jgi:S-disulfanyl-L-cysteine oxidoreductase SoxD
MKRPGVIALAVAVVAMASLTAQATAQSDSTAKVTPAGIYTAAQAERGKATHEAECTSCHGTEDYSAEAFTKAWGGRTAFDFFDLLRTTMPNDDPGKLKREQYADVVAYILSINGYPAGEQELPSDDEALKALKIDSLPPAKQP